MAVSLLAEKNVMEKVEDGLEHLLWKGYKSRSLGPLIAAIDNAAAVAISACKRLHSALARPATRKLEVSRSRAVSGNNPSLSLRMLSLRPE